MALLERGARTVCTPHTPPHETQRALGALGELVDAGDDAGDAAAVGARGGGGDDDDDEMCATVSPLADALLQCTTSNTESQRARIVLLSANSSQFAHDVALLGQVPLQILAFLVASRPTFHSHPHTHIFKHTHACTPPS